MNNHIVAAIFNILKLLVKPIIKTKIGIISIICFIMLLLVYSQYRVYKNKNAIKITKMEEYFKKNEFTNAIKFHNKTKSSNKLCSMLINLSYDKIPTIEFEKAIKYFEEKEYYEASKHFNHIQNNFKLNKIDYLYISCWDKFATFEDSLRNHYIKVEDYSEKSNFRYVLKENCGYSFINKFGKRINNDWYYKVWPFNNGIALVHSNGRYTLIDTLGNYKLEKFSHFINLENKEIRPILDGYKESDIFNKYGFALVEKDDKIGVINKKGDLIAECIYVGGIHQIKKNRILLRHRREDGSDYYLCIYNNGKIVNCN